MERLNSEGIARERLGWALRQKRIVDQARRWNSCLLCRRSPVNDSGLCEVCYAGLEGDELELALRWLSGAGP